MGLLALKAQFIIKQPILVQNSEERICRSSVFIRLLIAPVLLCAYVRVQLVGAAS